MYVFNVCICLTQAEDWKSITEWSHYLCECCVKIEAADFACAFIHRHNPISNTAIWTPSGHGICFSANEFFCTIRPASPYRLSFCLPLNQQAEECGWVQSPATPVYLQHKVALCNTPGTQTHNVLIFPFSPGCCFNVSTGYGADKEEHKYCEFFPQSHMMHSIRTNLVLFRLFQVEWLWIIQHTWQQMKEKLQDDVKSNSKQTHH